MIVPMVKVHLIGHRRRLDDTLAGLQRLEAVHLIDVTADPSVRLPPLAADEARLRETEDLRYLRARLAAVLALAPPPEPDGEPADLARVRDELEAASPAIEEAAGVVAGLEAERDTLPRHLESLRRLLPLVPELPGFDGYDTMAVVLDARHASVLGDLNARLTEQLAGNFEVISDRVDSATIGAILVFPKAARADVESLLGREQVSRLRLPHRFEAVPFREAIAAMEARLTEIPDELEAATNRLTQLVGRNAGWPGALTALSERLDQLAAIRHLGATAHTFVVSGWIPRPRLADLRRVVTEELGDEVLLEEAPAGPDEHPPVLMANRGPAGPFQSLVGLLALPRYGTIDPSRLMAIFLPLFFGMMLGDVAYGLVLLAAAGITARALRHRRGMARDLARVLTLSAVWTVVWGFVYGELLGDLGRRVFGLRPLWIGREEALTPLLAFSLAVGACHVVLGLLLGAWEAAREHDRRALGRRLGTLAALAGLFLVAGVAAGRLPEGAMTPGVAAAVVGLVVLAALEGPMGILLGPLALIEVVGNVLSYLRIAAIGLASVYLARVANELGAAGPLWLGVVVASLFHALNLALGAFSPTIQALRLHYVEFFGKFFEEGGEPFRPFGGERTATAVPAGRPAA